jgi:subtilisin family serine protease
MPSAGGVEFLLFLGSKSMMNLYRSGLRALLAAVLSSVAFALPALAADVDMQNPKAAPAAKTSAPAKKVSPYRPVSVPNKARDYYMAVWGVDNLLVQQTASGNLIRFSYRIVDPALAKPLAAKEATSYLFGQRSRAMLQIPVMDKIGQLRQTGTAKAGQEFWMVFSNKGNLIKPGDRVNVKIGSFHADGLLVK